jgi:hypothetical protein
MLPQAIKQNLVHGFQAVRRHEILRRVLTDVANELDRSCWMGNAIDATFVNRVAGQGRDASAERHENHGDLSVSRMRPTITPPGATCASTMMKPSQFGR